MQRFLLSSAQVTVLISVLDVNDNAPIITVNGSADVTTVTESIGEGQEPGQLVYVVVVSLSKYTYRLSRYCF